MDIKDRRLLYLLDLNSRTPATELAKKIGTTKQVIGYRIDKLVKEGVIKKFQTVPLLSALGLSIYANIYFKLSVSNKAKETEILTYLMHHKKIGYVGVLGGRFDLSIVLVSKDFQQLEYDLASIISKYPEELKEYEISLRLRTVKLSKKYLVEDKVMKDRPIFNEDKRVIKIDDVDKAIMKLLCQDSRMSIVDIGEKLKIPFSTVRVRIKNLESKGFIAAYSALFDLKKIGMLNYKVFIKTKDKTGSFSEELLSFAQRNKHVTWFLKTFGSHDYELRIETETQEDYHNILRELRSQFGSSLLDIETLLVFDELREDFSVVF